MILNKVFPGWINFKVKVTAPVYEKELNSMNEKKSPLEDNNVSTGCSLCGIP